MILLPWPSAVLSPNARHHFHVVGKAKKAARKAGFVLTRELVGHTPPAFPDGPIDLTITFYPPDKIRRDDDNMIYRLKSWRDGIADALKVDDSRFRPEYKVAEPHAPGRVEVCINTVNRALASGTPVLIDDDRHTTEAAR